VVAAAAPARGKKGRGGGGTGKQHAAHFPAAEVERRRGVWEKRIQRPDMQGLIAGREALPMAAFREQVVTALDASQVVLIAGETGCGKTTQVPQYILEDAWYRGKGCRVVCTQPRRISAVSGGRPAACVCACECVCVCVRVCSGCLNDWLCLLPSCWLTLQSWLQLLSCTTQHQIPAAALRCKAHRHKQSMEPARHRSRSFPSSSRSG
jgi:hypothetical protein